MYISRKEFLKTGSVVALAAIASDSLFASVANEENKKLKNFGLQMYSLRDDYPKDPKGILRQVAGMGYTQIEGFERDKGIFWGMTNTEFKSYMDSIGLTMVSTHCDTTKDFEKKAAEAAVIGMKYLIYPFEGSNKSIEDYKKMADDFNAKGSICKANGLRFAFHNHDFSFRQKNGEFPQDILMKNTDASLVDFEMDIYWVVAAGQDPVAWFKKYPGRFTACHVKDRSKNPGANEGLNSCNLGEGSIDYPSILKAAKKYGMKYHIVEQEAYPNGSPLEAARIDAGYMKKLKI